MQEQSKFGAFLKSYRLAAGLSQEALAARASLSARTISDLERGIHDAPRSDTLELLISALALIDQQRTLLLAFTEHVFGLPPLPNGADGTAYDFAGAFNFSQSPRPPIALPQHAVPGSSLRYIARHPPPTDDPT